MITSLQNFRKGKTVVTENSSVVAKCGNGNVLSHDYGDSYITQPYIFDKTHPIVYFKLVNFKKCKVYFSKAELKIMQMSNSSGNAGVKISKILLLHKSNKNTSKNGQNQLFRKIWTLIKACNNPSSV